MPSQSRRKTELAPTSWGTFGNQGTTNWLTSVDIVRARTWVNTDFRTARLRAERILSHGFLPVTTYVDNLQHVANSKGLTATGKLSTAANATFIWRFIPSVPRIACSVLDSDAVSAKSQALAKLQSKLSGVGVSVPLTIADAGKTASMIGQAAGRIATSYRHVRHGKFLAAAKALGLDKTPRRVGRYRSVDDNWLEYRYGWRLVVNDITSYMKQIHDLLTTKPVVYRQTAFVETFSKGSYTTSNVINGYSSWPDIFRCTKNGSTTRRVRADAGYIYSLESVPLSTGQQLGLLNPAAVAWDLIPASFMVDWAINVSSVLEGLTAFQGKNFLSGWTAVSVQTTRQEYWSNVVKGTSINRLDPGLEFFSPEVIERRFQRDPLVGFQADSLRLDFSASFQNGIDGLALIKQVFLGRRK